ncbi:PilN domain-containing protein [Azomonas macrocytogenes]|uniref:Type IV pilus assembly protein PilN n=1 Tax=Azomonas macrocytogenes TaxID=69962 RepID=A0A839T3H8_AZOMA|nr:PilN domain-containing protein [Azomonas macrocytogenes]MBB3102904.1 type IV pilus assembly protein PilN [Azomonas macrocytogenes]
MARINLLPWREHLREERQRRFLIILAGVFAVAGFIIFIADGFLNSSIEYQTARNTFIRSEISALDARIKEISELKTRRQQLLDRMKTIQSLQGNRPVIAHIFDQMVRTLPDGAYFTSLKMIGQNISIAGAAESNNRVSSLMRNLDASEWLEAPNLNEVKAANNGDAGGNWFQLTVRQTQPTAALQDAGKAVKGANR